MAWRTAARRSYISQRPDRSILAAGYSPPAKAHCRRLRTCAGECSSSILPSASLRSDDLEDEQPHKLARYSYCGSREHSNDYSI